MPDLDQITSVVNPRVKRLIRLRKPRYRREEGVLLAEGRREVSRADRAGLALRELWICTPLGATGENNGVNEEEKWFKSFFENYLSKKDRFGVAGFRPVRTTEAVFRKIAYHRDPEGLLAVFDAPRHRLDDVTLERGRLLVAVGTEKPGNLGAMVRTAAAAGCDAVLAVGPAVDVFNPNAIRNSTGAVFELPVVVVEREADAIAWLHRRRVRLATDGGSCFEADLAASPARPLAVVIGPEHAGLGPAWREAAGAGAGAVTIPALTEGVVDSLNASAAAAVLLFEVVRQSGMTQVR